MERVKLIAAPGIQIINSEMSAYEISIETKKLQHGRHISQKWWSLEFKLRQYF